MVDFRDSTLEEVFVHNPVDKLPEVNVIPDNTAGPSKPIPEILYDPKEIVKKYWVGSFTESRKKKVKLSKSKIRQQVLLTEELHRLEKETDLWKEVFSTHSADVIEELEREWTEFGGSNSVMSTEHEDYSSRTHSHTNSHESPSVPRKPPSGYNRLENQINLRHLVKLMKIFHRADESGSEGLNIKQFRAAFGRILGWKSEEQLDTMFKKIDTKSAGTIDWNDFCTYMLNEYQERETMGGQKRDIFPYPLKLLQSSVHEIATIAFLPSAHRQTVQPKDISASPSSQGFVPRCGAVEGRFVSVSKDGVLSLWNNDLTLHKVIMLDAGKLPLITDMVLIPNANKILVSLSDNMLSLYDISTGNSEIVANINHLPFSVTTMNYWYNPTDNNQAILILGDSEGGVCIFEFSRANTSLFVPAVGSDNIVSFHELLKQKYDGVKTTYFPKVHNDWVSQVKYWHALGYVMSCSNDDHNSLYLVDLNVQSRGSSLKIKKGVISFDFCREWNIIATGGLDRVLRFWNPYLTGKPIAILKGHLSAIIHVVISHHEHVFTFSKDMELRVWKISDQMCLQIINRCNALKPHPPTAFYVHPYTELVLIGATHLGALEPLDAEDKEQFMKDRALSHELPLCAALYNENFSQVVSGCHGSVISVWDVDTGEKIIQFSRCHGDHEITEMTFDPCGRRLLTGGKDGSLKLWNFNNGECLSILKNSYNAEVSSICFTSSCVIVGGWFRTLAVYGNSRRLEDSSNEENITPKYFAHGLHKEDVLSLAFIEPNILVSASYDGNIFVWDMTIDRVLCRLNAWDEIGRQPQCLVDVGKDYLNEEEEEEEEEEEAGNKIRAKTPSRDISSGRATLSPNDSRPPKITSKDRRAVEKVLIIPGRCQNVKTASMVACGAGGWVHMWNVYGGGLIGEFNIWSTERHQLEVVGRSLHSVTALKVDYEGHALYTGNSLGYIQIWNIIDYCIKVETPVIQDTPPLALAWKAHRSSIVSIDLAEGKGLIITASTDYCVRLWSSTGRYIGTFGERMHWNLTYPLKEENLPRRVPNALKRSVSYKTVQVMTGCTVSKWKTARNLFQMLREAKMEQLKKETSFRQHVDKAVMEPSECILGKYYTRKTRFRAPIVTMKLLKDGLFNIYGKINFTEIDTGDASTIAKIAAAFRSTAQETSELNYGDSFEIPRKNARKKTLLSPISPICKTPDPAGRHLSDNYEGKPINGDKVAKQIKRQLLRKGLYLQVSPRPRERGSGLDATPVASSADSARQSFEPYDMEWVEPAARLKERHTEESLFPQLVTPPQRGVVCMNRDLTPTKQLTVAAGNTNSGMSSLHPVTSSTRHMQPTTGSAGGHMRPMLSPADGMQPMAGAMWSVHSPTAGFVQCVLRPASCEPQQIADLTIAAGTDLPSNDQRLQSHPHKNQATLPPIGPAQKGTPHLGMAMLDSTTGADVAAVVGSLESCGVFPPPKDGKKLVCRGNKSVMTGGLEDTSTVRGAKMSHILKKVLVSMGQEPQ